MKADQLHSLVELQAALAEVQAGELDRSTYLVLSHLGRALRAPDGFLVLSVADEAEALGWRVVIASRRSPEEPFADIVTQWLQRDLTTSPSVRATIAGAGRHRVLRPRERMGAQVYEGSFLRADLERTGMRDRVVGVHSLGDQAEVFVGFDRKEADVDFDDGDMNFLLRAVGTLTRFSRWLALSYGAIPRGKILSERQRDVLGGLLVGKSEKELASDIGLTPGSLHQVVVRIYRRLGVRSRGELMALWLEERGEVASFSLYTAKK